MTSSKVESINRSSKSGLDGILIGFELERTRNNTAEALLCVDENKKYFMTLEDIKAFFSMVGDRVSKIDYFQYIVVPIRKATQLDEQNRGILTEILEMVDPDYLPSNKRSISVKMPDYKIQNYMVSYFEELFEKGEVRILSHEHIGERRARDAANLLKREVRRFMMSGIEKNGLEFSLGFRHDAGDASIRCYFEDEKTLNYFRQIYLSYTSKEEKR